MQCEASASMNSAQVPSPSAGAAHATRLPESKCASRPPPAATTSPLPSKPGTTGSLFVCPYVPRRKERSDGLTGAAATRTSTCPSPGRGTGFSATTTESAPPSYERNSTARMVSGIRFMCAERKAWVANSDARDARAPLRVRVFHGATRGLLKLRPVFEDVCEEGTRGRGLEATERDHRDRAREPVPFDA